MASQIDLINQYQSLAAQIRHNMDTKLHIMRLEAENRALNQQLAMTRAKVENLVLEILTLRRMVSYMNQVNL